jgi:hypothetical protein
MLLAADAHIGTSNLDYQMREYVFKRRADGKLYIYVKQFIRLYIYLVLTSSIPPFSRFPL